MYGQCAREPVVGGLQGSNLTCAMDSRWPTPFSASRGLEKMRASTQHFEQLTDTLCQTTSDIADLLRNTEAACRRLEVVVYVAMGMTIVQLFNLIFEVFRKR